MMFVGSFFLHVGFWMKNLVNTNLWVPTWTLIKTYTPYSMNSLFSELFQGWRKAPWAKRKRLELQSRAKPNMKGVWGKGTGKAGQANGFLSRGRLFRSKINQKIVLRFNMMFDLFWLRVGIRVGAIWGAKIDPNRAKFGPRRLLKRYFLQKAIFHENLVKPS